MNEASATPDGVLADVWVPGLPKTKGSLTRGRGGGMRESVIGSTTWRLLVAERVRGWRKVQGLTVPYDGPVIVLACFYLSADPIAARAGDLDKLVRNVLDACAADATREAANGGAYVNDNQVVSMRAEKIGPVQECGLRLQIAIAALL